MLRALFQSLLTVSLATLALPVLADESSLWVFEGLITEADPGLAPDLQSGWVLAGSFLYTPIEMTEQPVEAGPGAGRLVGGISEAEVTVDLYYQLHFSAGQALGMAGLDYQDNDPRKDGRDLLGWFIPMRGKLKETSWTSTWLQVWLADSSGKMIRVVPPAVSPLGVEWEHGWFRLTLQDEAGQTAFVDGRMEYFGPEDTVDQGTEEQWKDAAARLGEILVERDATIFRMQGELDESRQRIDGLRRMVDLLVQERTHLQEENAILQEEAEAADPEVEKTLNELSVQKTLLEERIEGLSARNNALAESLAESELERRQLLNQLQELEAVQDVRESAPEVIWTPEVPVFIEGRAAGTVSLTEQTVPVEEAPPLLPPAVVARPQLPVREIRSGNVARPPEQVAAPEKVKEDRDPSPLSRRRGPRKFR